MEQYNDISSQFLYQDLLLDYNINDTEFCMNNTVRSKYFTYIENKLKANALNHDLKFFHVRYYAQQIELWALRKSINSKVYREEVLKNVKILKKCEETNTPFTDLTLQEWTGATNILKLFEDNNEPEPDDESIKSSSDSCSTVDNDDSFPMLESPSSTIKMENFEENSEEDRTSYTPPIQHHPSNITSQHQPINITQTHQPTNMFSTHQPLQAITFDLPSNITSTNDVIASGSSQRTEEELPQNIDSITCDPIYQELAKMFTDDRATIDCSSSSSSDESTYLNNKHIWRCEYNIQKSSFLQQMYAIYVMNPEKYQRLNERLEEIFGPDSDYNVITNGFSMRELLKSLKMKVAHMVKHNLMPYYTIKRIQSSDVYKMIAKALTDRIMDINPYISFTAVQNAIQNCFNHRIRYIHARNVKDCIKFIIWDIQHPVN